MNCVFWNFRDERLPTQRGEFTPNPDETPRQKQIRETREANNKKRGPHLVDAIVNIARKEEVDLFLFAEYHLDHSLIGRNAALLERLRQQARREFSPIDNRLRSFMAVSGTPQTLGKSKHITIFSAIEPRPGSTPGQFSIVEVPADPFDEEPFDESRLTLHVLYLPGEPEPLLLACVHLISKRYANSIDQREEARRIARRIRLAERQMFKNDPPRTVVVGDFNMNPWEEGMALPDAFHSVEWYDFENAKPRGVWGKNYPYFYNPIWALWGDGRSRPGGSYSFGKKEGHLVRRWNLFDQILLRPAALDYWPANHREGCLRILDKADTLRLTTGKMLEPDLKNYSDHLPIFFRLGKYDEIDANGKA